MSDELPDDVSRWPSDPYALLNVPSGVDNLELKRAYTRLIRRFKPEQFPEQFRRIREAYDSILRYARFYEQFRPMLDSPAEVKRDADAPERPADPPTAPPNPVATAWDVAVRGDEAAAYHRLKELHDSLPGSEAAVGLYWLLTLYPELEPSREPVVWLIAALKRSNLGGPARELFRRELLDRPHAALNPDISQLWSAEAAPERVAELADWRWQSAALLQQWSVIENDLALLREPIRAASESAWLRLLGTATDLLAWVDPDTFNPTWADCIDEMVQMEFLARDHAYLFDRLDHLKQVAHDWQNWKGSPLVAENDLMTLVALAWTRPADELHAALFHFADKIRKNPLGWFDQLEAATIGGSALAFLADQIRMLPGLCTDTDSLDAEDNAVSTFGGSQFWQAYRSYHRELLEFCLRRRIAPELMAQAATSFGIVMSDGSTPSQLVQRDGAINLVYYAVQRLSD